jgi:hypothetical protein
MQMFAEVPTVYDRTDMVWDEIIARDTGDDITSNRNAELVALATCLVAFLCPFLGIFGFLEWFK